MTGWTDIQIHCRVCGEYRYVNDIAVLKHAHESGGVRVGCNVQYCTDRLACATGAADVCYVPNIPRVVEITWDDIDAAYQAALPNE